jgi:hypothetical protein
LGAKLPNRGFHQSRQVCHSAQRSKNYSITSSARASNGSRHGDAERLGGPEVQEHFDFRGLAALKKSGGSEGLSRLTVLTNQYGAPRLALA